MLQVDVAAKLLGFSRASAIALGATCLLLTALYLALAAMARRPLTIKHWEVSMPSLELALAQIFFGATNFCFVAAALYELLPPTAGIGYFAVSAVYVLADVASIVSHVPGGLGVLEVVVVHLLPLESSIGALVVFRVIYFLVPFTIGAALFAAYELTLRRRRGVFQS